MHQNCRRSCRGRSRRRLFELLGLWELRGRVRQGKVRPRTLRAGAARGGWRIGVRNSSSSLGCLSLEVLLCGLTEMYIYRAIIDPQKCKVKLGSFFRAAGENGWSKGVRFLRL